MYGMALCRMDLVLVVSGAVCTLWQFWPPSGTETETAKSVGTET